ncbi:MAG: 30S ribosomal protein S17 [Candidatus Nanohaloarchaea archaeon]
MDIGLEVKEPEEECNDQNCPFHGQLSVRGNTFTGEVKSTKMQKSATVKWGYAQEIPKYERKERRNTKMTVHVPQCLDIKEGDTVKVAETRPISKTKSAVIVGKTDEKVQQ